MTSARAVAVVEKKTGHIWLAGPCFHQVAVLCVCSFPDGEKARVVLILLILYFIFLSLVLAPLTGAVDKAVCV